MPDQQSQTSSGVILAVVAAALTAGTISVGSAALAPGSVDLTTKVTGVLPVANGGTNSATGLTNTANTFTATQSISKNAAALPAAGTGTVLRLAETNGTTTQLETLAFGTVPVIEFIRANNTAASPTAVASGDLLAQIGAHGYGATGYASGTRAYIRFLASQAWTDTAQGTDIAFGVTANGAAGFSEVLRVDHLKNLLMSITAPSGGGTPVFAILNAGVNPTGMAASTAGLVNKAGELYAWDASGNVTLISPHSMDCPAKGFYDDDDPLPRVVKEQNEYLGIIRWTNESRRARLFERMLNGEDVTKLPAEQKKLVHEVKTDRRSWDDDQKNHVKPAAVPPWVQERLKKMSP